MDSPEERRWYLPKSKELRAKSGKLQGNKLEYCLDDFFYTILEV